MFPFDLEHNGRTIAKVFSSNIEETAKQQLCDMSELKGFLFIKAFPDIHGGNDFPVGYVMKTRDYFYPQLIGADIGCSVAGIPVKIPDRVHLDKFVDKLAHYVKDNFTNTTDLPSLGGGNHFFDISEDQNGQLWFVIHTGSRGIGGKMYSKIKKELDFHSLMGVNVRSRLFNFVIWQMFTEAKVIVWNRNIYPMLESIKESFGVEIDYDNMILTEHNTICQLGRMVYHYKGASYVPASGNVMIPLSMEHGTLVVHVNKPEELFYGINHGAGRAMRRREANEKLTEKDLDGVNYLSNRLPIDEAGKAYKNIDKDMLWMEEN
jgi:RNA-splicing ligase RtcB